MCPHRAPSSSFQRIRPYMERYRLNIVGQPVLQLQGWKDTLLYATLRYSTQLYATLRYSTLLYATLTYATLRYSMLLYRIKNIKTNIIAAGILSEHTCLKSIRLRDNMLNIPSEHSVIVLGPFLYLSKVSCCHFKKNMFGGNLIWQSL
jgi:hypothetical protein